MNPKHFLAVMLLVGLDGVEAANLQDLEMLINTGNCFSCDLSGADLQGRLLKPKSDLSSTDLRGANFYKAQLIQANLEGANFAGANLKQANLVGANMQHANFSGANLDKAMGFNMLANTAGIITDGATTCPDGTAGPCNFLTRI